MNVVLWDIFVIVFIAWPLGAIGRRIAGGVLSQWLGFSVPDQLVRLLWGGCLGVTAFVSGATWWQALGIVPLLWAGSTCGMFGAFSMGRSPGRNFWTDSGLMLVYGAACVLPIAVAAMVVGFGWLTMGLAFAALMCPVAYAVAWDEPLQAPWLGCYDADPTHLTDPPPTAELVWGAAVGGAIASLFLFNG